MLLQFEASAPDGMPLLVKVSTVPEDRDDYPDLVFSGTPEEVGAYMRGRFDVMVWGAR